MTHDDGLPDFCKISAERRKMAWEEYYRTNPTRKQITTGWQPSQAEKDYRASKERDKALKRAIKEPERREAYAKKKAEAAEIKAVKEAAAAVNNPFKKKRRGRPPGSKNKPKARKEFFQL